MLILVRGIPGSGKSTFAKNQFCLQDEFIHLEADMFFTDHFGNYNFNRALLSTAHSWCIETARIFMNHGIDVVVSNTFTTHKEMKPYIEHAEKIGAPVFVYRLTNNYGSIHNVPEDVIENMKARFQDYPKETIIGGM